MKTFDQTSKGKKAKGKDKKNNKNGDEEKPKQTE